MRFRRTTALLAVLSTAAAVGLAACGTTETPVEPEAAPEAKQNAAAEPVIVTDARDKKVTLPDGPAKRVVALEWSEVEDLVTLGVMPVGVADVKGYGTWNDAAKLDDSVTNVGMRGEASVDAIVALQPDLIITEVERSTTVVAQLEKTAPVIVMEGSDASRNIEHMKENFELIATAVGKEDVAAKILPQVDQAVADGKKKLAAAGVAGDGFAMADGWMEGSSVSIRMFGKGSLMSDLAEELGLRNQWKGKVDPMWGLGNTDVEGMTALSDVHFFYSASEDDVFREGLADNAIWKSRPFVQKDQLYKLEPGTWTFGGPRSCISFVNQVVKALAS
jgi:ferric hydroxamate transport system substrate-binding protein